MRKILVVDDDASVRSLVRDVLEVEGYDVEVAEDGFAALRRVEANRPDCIVLDVMMPGMSGWEVCRAVREDDQLEDTGVLMLTGIGERLNEMTSPLYGADDFLDKPFDLEDLDEKIRGVVKKRAS